MHRADDLWSRNTWTVAEAAATLKVAPRTVRRWLKLGHLRRAGVGTPLQVEARSLPQHVSEFLIGRAARPRPFSPSDIVRYSPWHHTLDEFVWLIKTAYSEPFALKRRQFRLDVLFGQYLVSNGAWPPAVRADFGFRGTEVPSYVWEDLFRGWYNELAFSIPPRSATLGLSFADIGVNQEATEKRFLFPSWRIITAYYAIYFYLRAITRLKQPSFRVAEHNATLVNFKSCALGPLQKHLWRFPFNLEFDPHRSSRAPHPSELRRKHMKHGYARHPRSPHRPPAEIVSRIRRLFRRRGTAGQKPNRYTLFEYLRDFRIWANYLEIQHLLNLRGVGYKGFLDQSLSTIVFFLGGVAELVVLAATTERHYRARFQSFYELLCDADSEYLRLYPELPPAQRTELFVQLGILRSGLVLRPRPNPNRVRLVSGEGV